MTFTDYLIDISLIGIVLFQVRGRRLTTRALLLPVGIVAYVAYTYLRSVPTAGNDLFLVAGCAALGALLGGLAGRFTTVRADAEGFAVAKAGVAAAALWILGTGGRLAFQVYASHGGGPAIERFSVSHDITSAAAWTAALILMALCEAVVRTGILGWRAHQVARRAAGVAGAGAAPSHVRPVSSVPVLPAPPAPRRPVLSGARSIMEAGERPS
jgi:hypothetical protein